MNKAFGVLVISLSFSIGAFVGYFLTTKKYETLLKEEVSSVKETYAKKLEEMDSTKDPNEEPLDDNNADLVEEWLDQDGDGVESELRNVNVEEDEKDEGYSVDIPYIIKPSDFNEIYGYESETLTLYSDGILATEDFDIIEDIEDAVGTEYIRHFGEYEDDCVYVRNDIRCCDYEILRSTETYEDAFTSFKEYEERYE